jgi:protein ImuB
MKRALAVWLPNWPVQRQIAARPELTDRALVLYERDVRRGERVRACCRRAADRGIRPGMPLAEVAASGIPEKTGPSENRSYHVTRHQPDQDRQALFHLAIECEQFSPLVGMAEGQRPDELQMDLRGLDRVFGSEGDLYGRVEEFFQRRGYQVRLAIADTPSAASALARYPTEAAPPIITVPGDRSLLDQLPVAALRLPEHTQQMLQHLGVDCLGRLQSLPRGSLAARFDALLLQRLDQILGRADEVIVACREPEELDVRMAFEHPVVHPEAILWAIQRLLVQLAERLNVRGWGVLQLECQLVCQGGRSCEIRVGLFQVTADPDHLLGLIRMQLEQHKLPDAVHELRVAATSTAVRESRQRELFAESMPRDLTNLGALIERLSSRLGLERVLRAELQAEAQVERAYQCHPLTGEPLTGEPLTGGRSLRNDRSPPAAPGPMFRPLRLFDPPRPIEVIGIAMEGPPAKFFDRRETYQVARSFGPERIETGWWRGPSVRRDYYRVETTGGNRLWLFRRLQDQRWFLHGEFE